MQEGYMRCSRVWGSATKQKRAELGKEHLNYVSQEKAQGG